MRIYNRETTNKYLFSTLERQRRAQSIREKNQIHRVLSGSLVDEQEVASLLRSSQAETVSDFALQVAKKIDNSSAIVAPLTQQFKTELSLVQSKLFNKLHKEVKSHPASDETEEKHQRKFKSKSKI